MKIGDIFIYVLVLILIGGSFLGLRLMKTDTEGRRVIIELEGNIVEDIPITKDMEPREIRVDTGDGGYNIIVIDSEGVDITDANCADRVCVYSGKISITGQSIICLPHKLVIKIIGKGGQGPSVDDIAS